TCWFEHAGVPLVEQGVGSWLRIGSKTHEVGYRPFDSALPLRLDPMRVPTPQAAVHRDDGQKAKREQKRQQIDGLALLEPPVKHPDTDKMPGGQAANDEGASQPNTPPGRCPSLVFSRERSRFRRGFV